jgi:hypothetical protein
LNIVSAIWRQQRVQGVNFGSGIGREFGRYGIEAFLEPRAVLE